MGLTLTTPALTSPVSIEDGRRQCRIHASDTRYDADLTEIIADAVAHVERDVSLVFEPAGFLYTLDAFDGDIILPVGPLISVESVKYYDADDVLQTIDPSAYTVVLTDRKIVATDGWPGTASGLEKVEVDFTAGYEGELDSATYISATPRPLRRAILLLVGHWFAHREAVGIGITSDAIKLAYEDLVATYKQPVIA